jgi:hypothetical protein
MLPLTFAWSISVKPQVAVTGAPPPPQLSQSTASSILSSCLSLYSGAKALVKRTTGRLYASLMDLVPTTFELADLLQEESDMAEAEAADADLAAKEIEEAKTQEERDEADIAFILKVGRRRAARLLRLRVASQEVAPGLMSKRRLPNQHLPKSRKRGPRSAEELTKVESTSASFLNSAGSASSAGTGCREWLKKAKDAPVDEGERSRWCMGTARSGRNTTSTASASKSMRSTRLSQQTVSVCVV